jgi:hypothetical protein
LVMRIRPRFDSVELVFRVLPLSQDPESVTVQFQY